MVDLAMAAGPGATAATKATTTATFSADVLVESQRVPVVVLFLSARSEACRTLLGVLERTVRGLADKLKLVTMDIDSQPQIASRLGIRSVPAVYAFQRGQPVDGFAGALPEAQVKGFIERLTGPLDDGSAEILAEAEAALATGDLQTAAALFADVYEQLPDNMAAAAGLIRVMVASGELDGARGLIAQLPPTASKDPVLAAALAALENAEQASSIGDLAPLERAVAADPDDHQARFDLAVGLNGAGRREEAGDMLLESLRRDRTWNDGAARRQLLQFFEAWGLMDPMTLATRRKLSTLLFA